MTSGRARRGREVAEGNTSGEAVGTDVVRNETAGAPGIKGQGIHGGMQTGRAAPA